MTMTYEQFLERVIDEGIAAARRDYTKPHQEILLEGSIAGFEACRGKTPRELGEALATASRAKMEALSLDSDDPGWYMGYRAEVEWVCNVVSARQMNRGQPTIVTPTANGVLKAAEILGVGGAG